MWLAQDHRDRRWLFPNSWRTGPVATHVLVRTFANALKAADLPAGRRATPHTLRHNSECRIIPSGHLEAAGFAPFEVWCST
jgi:integrase